jgi:hypothetical protein
MAEPSGSGFDLTVDPDDLVGDEELVPARAAQDPDAAFEDYAELARLFRAADAGGDSLAMTQIRDEMDRLFPALTEEQRDRIEDGEFE